ncbi:hypothetical protein XELAEV_18037457mg [Xenopus laevis]|uniref:Uncharacterized protein n=1 Tax=Xenopus laevis TaxID=8355 RepID=A0A974HA70_XENLA|nr:hypothetical protein XELAEV_18037457mg [Xenopus laevis]
MVFLLALVYPFLFFDVCISVLALHISFYFVLLFFFVFSHSHPETKYPEEVLKKTEGESLQFRRFFFPLFICTASFLLLVSMVSSCELLSLHPRVKLN